jgi:hypothetical protein
MTVLDPYLYPLNHSSYVQYSQHNYSAAMEGTNATPGLPSIIPVGPKVTKLSANHAQHTDPAILITIYGSALPCLLEDRASYIGVLLAGKRIAFSVIAWWS